MSQIWNRQHDLHVLHRLLELSRPMFTKETWEVFTRVAIHGQPADLVAEAAILESHIGECSPCCETLLGLQSDDTFVGLLQNSEDVDQKL